MATGFPVKPLELVDLAWLNSVGARMIGDIAPAGTTGPSFTSIPQTYSHLLLLWKGQSATDAGTATVQMRLNSISTANYHDQLIQALAATPSASEALLATSGRVGSVPGSTGRTDAHYQACGMVLMPGYSLATSFPTYVGLWQFALANSTGNLRSSMLGGALQSATGSISAVQLILSTGTNWATGSRATLYGMT